MEGQRGELFVPSVEETIRADHETFDGELVKICERSIEVPFAACTQHMEPEP
jgi:hypothetical protein